MCVYDYKKGFIALAFTIEDWIIQQWCLHARGAENPVAAQSKKLEAAEQEEPMTQPPYKLPGESPIWVHRERLKKLSLMSPGEAGAIDELTQKEWSLPALTGFLFFPLSFHPVP
jgi:hypothetical protein